MLIENHLSYLSHYPLILIFIGALLASETIVLFAAIICHNNGLSIYLVISIAVIGTLIGNQIWFYIGENYGAKLLKNHARLQKDTLKFRNWVDEKSTIMALTSRFIYSAGSIIPILLGLDQYPKTKYLLLNTIGALLWGIIITKLGFIFGKQAYAYFNKPHNLEFILLFIISLILVRWWFKHKSIANKLS